MDRLGIATMSSVRGESEKFLCNKRDFISFMRAVSRNYKSKQMIYRLDGSIDAVFKGAINHLDFNANFK